MAADRTSLRTLLRRRERRIYAGRTSSRGIPFVSRWGWHWTRPWQVRPRGSQRKLPPTWKVDDGRYVVDLY